MNRLSLDFETRSRADLKKVGGYKYAEDPSTEVLVVAVQQHGTDRVLSWDIRETDFHLNDALQLLYTAISEKWEIHAFNSSFEWAILKYVCPRQFGFPVPDINTMRCTAAVCRSAGLPPSLAKSAEFLKLPVRKDTIGHSLIRKFSVPDKAGNFASWDTPGSFTLMGERVTHGEAFQKFVDYCEQDVRTELAVSDAMKPYHLKGFPLQWFLFDARLNDRGVPVDEVALQAADAWLKAHEERLAQEFRKITGLSPNQNAACLQWFKARGYRFDSLAVRFREQALRGSLLDDEARAALQIKGELSYAAVKKIPSMRDMVMGDGRIRGSFMWCGAQKTWRWTSRTPQWQNMKKAPKWLRPMIEGAYQTMRNGDLDLDTFEWLYGPPYEVIASMARYFVREDGRNLLDLDYSSVEARILPYLIGADRIMHKIRTGGDIYTSTASALGKELKERHRVDFDIDRNTAKTIVLATQFQGGWHAVFTATGEKWNREWCETAVKIVRRENPELPEAWRAFQDAFVSALDHPDKWIKASEIISFGFTKRSPFPRLLMRLASGRKITMPYPEKDPITMCKLVKFDPETGKDVKTRWERVSGHLDEDDAALALKLGDAFINPNTRLDSAFHTWELSFYGHIKGVNYGRVPTYGGDLLQSCFTGDTKVLTLRGAVPISQMDPSDRVWDGVEWVRPEHLVNQGKREVMDLCGLRCTPNHLFMVDTDWVCATNIPHDKAASQSTEFARKTLRAFDRHLLGSPAAKNAVESAMRLRSRKGFGRKRDHEVKSKGEDLLPSVPAESLQNKEEAWALKSPNLCGTRLNDVPVLPQEERLFSSLRGAGDKSVQAVAQPGELLQGHAAVVGAWVDPRPHQPERGLHPEEHPVGYAQGEQLEQRENPVAKQHPVGEDNRGGSLGEIGGQLHDTPLPLGGGCANGETIRQAKCREEVFDLVNCGPRNRFTVITDYGLMLAHNCTQATGADLLAHGAIEAEKAGFEPFMLVHDQCLAPDDGRRDEFERVMCSIPEWFQGFPLEADAESVRSYQKT